MWYQGLRSLHSVTHDNPSRRIRTDREQSMQDKIDSVAK